MPLTQQTSVVNLHSTEEIPEPHEFDAELRYQQEAFKIEFREGSGHGEEGHHGGHHDDCDEEHQGHQQGGDGKARKYESDNNFRAAILHVVADAFVSVLTILAIAIAGTVPGAWFLNPAVGIVGSLVIMSWAFQLANDTMGALLDLAPDALLNDKLRDILEADGQSTVRDMHVWKLGPGKLGAIFSLASSVAGRTRQYYWDKLKRFKPLAHVTIEICVAPQQAAAVLRWQCSLLRKTATTTITAAAAVVAAMGTAMITGTDTGMGIKSVKVFLKFKSNANADDVSAAVNSWNWVFV